MHELVYSRIHVCKLDHGLVIFGWYSETIVIGMTVLISERVSVTNKKQKEEGLSLSDKLASVKN
jgi:hypothetical protein